jgi:hypothetical protein
MSHPLVTGNNGSDFDEDSMTESDWYRRGHEQAAAMINGLTPEYANADADGDPTGGCLDGDYTELQRANAWDKIDDEYFEAEIDQDVWRAIRREPPKPS